MINTDSCSVSKAIYGPILIVRVIGEGADMIRATNFFANYLSKEPKKEFCGENSNVYFTNLKNFTEALKMDFYISNFQKYKDKNKLEKSSEDYAQKYLDGLPSESYDFSEFAVGAVHSVAQTHKSKK